MQTVPIPSMRIVPIYHLLRPLEEFSFANHQYHRTKCRVNHKYGMKPLYKEETNEFNEVRHFPTSSRQKGEHLIQTTEL